MEELKLITEITSPDIRSTCWVSIDKTTGAQKSIDLNIHHNAVQKYQLHLNVPENIRSHFITALNLLLYTWYVFRFYKVAEMHALTTLEFALREKLGEKGLKELKANSRRKGLHSYIEYAVDNGWIKNEDFSAYHRAPRLKAEYERSQKLVMRMIESNLDMLIDDEEIEVPEENDYDFLGFLQERPNKVRNEIAHGSNGLDQEAWLTFEYCTEFINKIYEGSER